MRTRQLYISSIKPLIGNPQIKVVTGLRRSGKSTVLKMVVEELTKQAIEQQRIISINFESFAFAPYTTSMALYQYISERITSDAQHYVLLDEI